MNMKIKWLRDRLRTQNLQGMIVSNPVNVKYLTGIEAEGELLITLKENFFITDSRYVEAVNTILTIEDEILVNDKKNLTKDDYAAFFIFCENVGFEEYFVTYAEYKELLQKYRVNLMETEHIVEAQRVIKDEKEIQYIEKACEITDKCFEYLKSFIKIGMTEKEIAFEIEKFYKTNGADDVSFEPIVASGHNSSMPHAVPGTRKIKDGDLILIDMGCKYKGYCSDMTRMMFVNYMEDEYKEPYEICLRNNESAERELKDGKNMKVIAQNSNNDLKQNGYTPLHSLGHGVGLDIHEEPFFGIVYDQPLKENMVVTVEPGVYKSGQFGIRIEDTVLITKLGCQKLTRSPKEPTIIEG
ncbi:MAG: aminopeptidase P family protein [Clostridia bacterium]|nr:aminopeptidase P family protein [Clostridia bacterium]